MSESETVVSENVSAANGEAKMPPPPLGPRALTPPQGFREMPVMPLALLEDDEPIEGMIVGAADFDSFRVLVFISGHEVRAKHPDGTIVVAPPVMPVGIAAISDQFALLSFNDIEPGGKGTGSVLARGGVPLWIVHPRGWFTETADGRKVPRYRIACGEALEREAAQAVIAGWRELASSKPA